MPAITVTVDLQHDSLRLDPVLVERASRLALREEGIEQATVGIVLCDHATLRTLNRDHLGHDYDTDVLSFDLGGGPDSRAVDGEVYVDLDTAAERFSEFDATFEEEVCRYVVHGLLHLAGHDDNTPAARRSMRELEDTYLRLLRTGAA